MTMNNKIERGQFFTEKNVFTLKPFQDWWNIIPSNIKHTILEPFAGANNIIKLLNEINLINDYKSYDIEPKDDNVIERDCFLDFPKGFGCIITNPPYLSKNSASKKKIDIKFGIYQDLYEISLNKCLDNCKYVAAIIPESFITTNRFKDRLYSVISLTYSDMFSDTEHPVCLALFVPEYVDNYSIYKNNDFIGKSQNLEKIKNNIFALNQKDKRDIKVRFNIPQGNIHLLAVDNNFDSSGIYFTTKEVVKESEIKISSRARTRINLLIDGEIITNINILENIINEANNILKEYRKATSDVFMTSFKGLRRDNYYRRRLDFDTAKKIIMKATEKVLCSMN